MAVLYISEFAGLAAVRGAQASIGAQPSLVDQTVAIGAGSAQSKAFGPTTNMVLICADAVCSVLFGANPTATAVNMRIPANFPMYFAVSPGQKVAVITNT